MAQSNTYDSRPPLSLMVLGCPAAGAPQLVNILQHLGCDLPLESQQSRTDGTRDTLELSPAISALNAQIFGALGRAPSDLGLPRPHWRASPVYEGLVREAAALLEVQFDSARLPVLWAPQLPVLADLWRDALRHCGYEVACLHLHGDPQAGAASEDSEVPLPTEHGQLAWLRDVLSAERATRGQSRLYLAQSGLAQDWRTEIAAIEQALGFAFPRNTAKTGRHIDAALQTAQIRAHARHNAVPRQAEWLREVAEILDHWRQQGEAPADHARLDAICADFEIAAEQIDIFTEALRDDGAAQRQKARKLEAALTEQQRAREAADASAQRLQAELEKVNEVQERALAHLAQAEERHGEFEAMEQQLAGQDKDALTRLQTALEERDTQIRRLENSLEQRFEELATLTRLLFDTEAQTAEKLARLSREVQEARERERYVQGVIDDVLSSTSWKLTAPVRRTLDFLRGSSRQT